MVFELLGDSSGIKSQSSKPPSRTLQQYFYFPFAS